MAGKTKGRYRDSDNGRFTTKSKAVKSPKTHEHERIKKRKK